MLHAISELAGFANTIMLSRIPNNAEH